MYIMMKSVSKSDEISEMSDINRKTVANSRLSKLATKIAALYLVREMVHGA